MGKLDAEQQRCDIVLRHRLRCDRSTTMPRDRKKYDRIIKSNNLVRQVIQRKGSFKKHETHSEAKTSSQI